MRFRVQASNRPNRQISTSSRRLFTAPALRILALLAACALAMPTSRAAEEKTPSEQERHRRINVGLSSEEIEFLEKHDEFRVGIDPSWEPLDFINTEGAHDGLAAEMLRLVGKTVGVRFRVVPTASWEESLEFARRGEIDILAFMPEVPGDESWVSLSTPYYHESMLVLGPADAPYLPSPHHLKNKRIAELADGGISEQIREQYPDLHFIAIGYQTTDETVAAVLLGEADYCVLDMSVAAGYFHRHGTEEVQILGALGIETAFGFGVPHAADKPELVGILNKALTAIPVEAKEQAIRKWAMLAVDMQAGSIETRAELSRTRIAGVVILAVIAIAWMWTLHRAGRRLAKVRDALRREEQRTKSIISWTELPVWDWDGQNRVTANAAAARLHGHEAKDATFSLVSWLRHVHPDERLRVRSELHSAPNRTDPYADQYRIIDPDGRTHTIAARGETIRHGLPQGDMLVSGVLCEVAPSDEASTKGEATVPMSVQRADPAAGAGVPSSSLQEYLDGARAFCFDLNLTTGVQQADPRLWNWLGYPEAEHPANMEAVLAITHPLDREAMRRHMRLSGSPGAPTAQCISLESRIRRQDGNYVWTIRQVRRVMKSDGVHLVGMCWDTDHRKRIEERLYGKHNSEFGPSPTCIITWDDQPLHQDDASCSDAGFPTQDSESRHHVLVIGASLEEIAHFRKAAERFQFVLDETPDISDAIGRTMEHSYPLIFLHCSDTPGKGAAQASYLRTLLASKKEPLIIGMLADSDHTRTRKYLEAGFDELLVRPISQEAVNHEFMRLADADRRKQADTLAFEREAAH